MAGKRVSTVERRKEILEIALEIIFDKGFYNLTIRNIAEKIGISEAAIYRHYQNKEDIIDNLTDLVFVQEDSRALPEDEGDSAAYLEEIMREQLLFFEDNPYLAAVTFQDEIFREYPRIREKFNNCRVSREEGLTRIIERGQKKGCFSRRVNPEIFAVIYLGTIRMSVLRWKNSGFSYSLSGEAPGLCRELFKILKTPEKE